ncbi:MAG: hypothetical protein JST06_04735 [Bacteroidetes bacterium]|nr:hypothetical protein [Bacteroidota bacterium]
MSQKKVALIELYDSHAEVLYSQLRFLLEGGYEVTLIVSAAHKNLVAAFDGDFQTQYVSIAQKRGLPLLQALWQIRSLILKSGIGTVIFNTAHSNPVRNFCLFPFPKSIRFFGVLHGVNKLQGSLSQRIISRRIPNYFLLADYMLEKALKVRHEGLRFCVFYPMFHPAFPQQVLVQRRPEELWIAMPGAVEFKRRDYLSLLEALIKMQVRPRLRFLLLGNARHPAGNGPELRQKLRAEGLEDLFLFFDHFLPDELLHSYLRECDAVMPLIHPINTDMGKYLENQISGAFPLAFAYRKPLLMHEYYQRYQDFRDTSIFYSFDKLHAILAALPKALAEHKKHDHYGREKWTFAFQAKHYCAYLKH